MGINTETQEVNTCEPGDRYSMETQWVINTGTQEVNTCEPGDRYSMEIQWVINTGTQEVNTVCADWFKIHCNFFFGNNNITFYKNISR